MRRNTDPLIRLATRVALATLAAVPLALAVQPGAAVAQPARPARPAPRSCAAAPGTRATTRCLTAVRRSTRLNRTAPTVARLHGAARRPGATPPADVSSLCSQGFSNPDRFTSCSDDGWEIDNTETTDGVTTVVGTLSFEIISSAQFGTNGTLTWSLDANIVTDVGTGTLSGGLSGTIGTKCGIQPSVCLTDSGNDGFDIALEPLTTTTWTWDQSDNGNAVTIANSVDNLTGFIGVVLDLNAPGNPVLVDDSAGNTLWGRCDNVISPADCVDPNGPMFVAFDATTNPLIGPVADHVYNAEAALPSHWGNPNYGDSAGLTRDMNDNDINANRDVACPAGQTPPGMSCDEYPMATTHQGAAFSAPGDWSIAYVPPSANNSQGGVLENFYAFYHVLDGDEYFVQAIRSDGSSSW